MSEKVEIQPRHIVPWNAAAWSAVQSMRGFLWS
jgi:hypothetical protein